MGWGRGGVWLTRWTFDQEARVQIPSSPLGDFQGKGGVMKLMLKFVAWALGLFCAKKRFGLYLVQAQNLTEEELARCEEY